VAVGRLPWFCLSSEGINEMINSDVKDFFFFFFFFFFFLFARAFKVIFS